MILHTKTGMSVLYGLIRGIGEELNIEEGEIAGCVQYCWNDVMNCPCYAMIFYDKTPGGAGHVRRLASPEVIERVLKTTLRLMEECNCGGDDKDSSCYQCLRNYYNQKYHDVLSRKVVIEFVRSILHQ